MEHVASWHLLQFPPFLNVYIFSLYFLLLGNVAQVVVVVVVAGKRAGIGRTCEEQMEVLLDSSGV